MDEPVYTLRVRWWELVYCVVMVIIGWNVGSWLA
jgi:hypothetical protein